LPECSKVLRKIIKRAFSIKNMQIIRVKGINSTGKTKGCEKAPVEILESLGDFRTNERGHIIDKKLFDLEEIHVDNSNAREANELIYKNSRKIFEAQDRALFVGGDHSISYGLLKGFSDNYQNGFLVVFDAHADCMFSGGTNEEWLRKLVEEGFPARNIIIAGARNILPEEKEFLQENKIQVFGMEVLREKEEICDIIMERARNSDGFYISIDIDVVDPAFAPGTARQEPAGLSSRELIYFLQRLMLLKNFRGADIVEINPDLDDGKTVKLGAKILAELI
jgi:arginase family enzyme